MKLLGAIFVVLELVGLDGAYATNNAKYVLTEAEKKVIEENIELLTNLDLLTHYEAVKSLDMINEMIEEQP